MEDSLEGFEQSEFLFLCATDPHEARTRELESIARSKMAVVQELRAVGAFEQATLLEADAIRDFNGAVRISNCGTTRRARWFSKRYQSRYCRRRDCPGCGPLLARTNANRVAPSIGRMRNRLVTLFTYPVKWRPGDDPKVAQTMVTAFRKALLRLRRRRFFVRSIAGGAGAIETKLANDLAGFNLHAHIVLDPDHPEVRNADALASYVTRDETWDPNPGSIDLARLDVVRQAIRGRQLVIAWGSATTERKARSPSEPRKRLR